MLRVCWPICDSPTLCNLAHHRFCFSPSLRSFTSPLLLPPLPLHALRPLPSSLLPFWPLQPVSSPSHSPGEARRGRGEKHSETTRRTGTPRRRRRGLHDVAPQGTPPRLAVRPHVAVPLVCWEAGGVLQGISKQHRRMRGRTGAT